MNFRKYTNKLLNGSEEVRFYRLLVAGLLFALLFALFLLGKAMGSSRTIVTPPEIKREFWINDVSVSQSYLEEMAYWYAGLALNITPQAAEFQNKLFLQYADPADAGRLAVESGARTEFIRKNSAATVFAPRTIAADMPNLRIALTGTLSTYVADKRAGERNATYMIGFKYRNGNLYVTDFKETSDQDPFALGTPVH